MVPLERRMDSAYERMLLRVQDGTPVERSQIRGLGSVILEMEQLNNNMKSIQSEIQRDIRARRKYFEAEQKLLKKDIQQQQGFQTAALFDLRKVIGLASFGIAANELAQGDIGGAAQGIGLGTAAFLPEIAQGVIAILAAKGLIGGLGGGLRTGGMVAGGLGMLGGGKGKAILALASVGALLLSGKALAGGRSDTKRLRTIQESKKDPLLQESDVGRFSRQLTRFNTALVDIEETKEKEAESTISPQEVGDATASKVKSDNKSSDQEPVISADQSKSTIIPPSDTTPDVMDDNVTEEDVNQEAERIGLNKGGQVPGSGNTDTVPAMLTPGEVVMSKPAVDAIGVDNLLAMNAAGGGTNKPTLMGEGGFANITNTMSSSSSDSDGSFSVGKRYIAPEEAKEFLSERGMPSMELMDGTVVPDIGKMGAEKIPAALASTREMLLDSGAPPENIAKLDELIASPDVQPAALQNSLNRIVPGSTEQVLGDMGDSISMSAKKTSGYKGGGLVQRFKGGGTVSSNKNIEPVESKSGGTAPLVINQGGKNIEIPSLPPVPPNITGDVNVSTIFDGSIDKLESAYALQTYVAFG